MIARPLIVSRVLAIISIVCTLTTAVAPVLRAEGPAPADFAPAVARSASSRPLRLIVGFMGGRVRANNLLHMEATVAQDLRDRNGKDLKVLVFANHDGGAALRTVLNLIDCNGDHTISDAERHSVDIAIYGHSWGASEAINLARSLQKERIPVALTVQVDSVQKPGEDDADIPANVREAVNLYQRDGLLRGRDSIRAEDASKTRIVLNERYHYGAAHPIDISRFPWFARTFMRQHIMIENDPEVWSRVEGLLDGAVQMASVQR